MKELNFILSKSQGTKLAHAYKKNEHFTLILNKNKISPSGIPLPISDEQFNLLMDGRNHRITIHRDHVKKGGFLPALLAAIPAIAGILGIGAAGTTVAKNIYDMAKNKGKGLYLTPKSCGCGLLLTPRYMY